MRRPSRRAVSLMVLGVVFGDIGTSPLYAIQACFHAFGLAASPENILGVLSLVTWSLILVVSLKYIVFVMRADNKGEGGVLALLMLAQQRLPLVGRTSIGLTLIGMLGAAMFYGDSVITPAISVLSAVEGLEVLSPGLERAVVPLSAMILVALFFAQKRGSAQIGTVFGPIMVIWFSAIGLLGLAAIVRDPQVLAAFDPTQGARFMAREGTGAFVILGAVVLAVTGVEALYADMGHFGRPAISRVWTFVVMPALLLNYLGQGALLLQQPDAIANPFYNLTPKIFLIPMVLLASAATVIASQAVISGAYTLAQQAIQLGFLPRMTVRHTSSREVGQIYIPFVNWALLFAVLLCVLGFRSSESLASAYGIAVTMTMTVTTILMWAVCRHVWFWNRARCIAVILPLLVIDAAFLVANLLKFSHGGWLPATIGALLLVVMTTWHRGYVLMTEAVAARGKDRATFLAEIAENPPARTPGSAIFLTRNSATTPLALLNNLRCNGVLHECVLFLTVTTARKPFVDEADRLHIDELAPRLFAVTASYGFMERPDVPRLIEDCAAREIPLEPGSVTYFLSKEAVVARGESFGRWRGQLFAFLSRNSQSAVEFFRLPETQVVELGAQVDL